MMKLRCELHSPYFASLLLLLIGSIPSNAVNYLPLAESNGQSEQCFNGGKVVTSDQCPGTSQCCECPEEWSGIGCSRQRCNNRGEFNVTTKLCECHDLRGGPECDLVTQCFNGGTLINGVCTCPSDWKNDLCGTPICRNGTLSLVSKSSCTCDLGYYGQFCEKPLICIHGNLNETLNECVCESGFAQPVCEICQDGLEQVSTKTETNETKIVCQLKAKEPVKIANAGNDLTGIWVVLGILLAMLVLGIVIFIIWKCSQKNKNRSDNKINPYEKNPPTIESPSSFDAEAQTSRPPTVKAETHGSGNEHTKSSLGSNDSFDKHNRKKKTSLSKFSPRIEKKSPRRHQGPRPDWVP